MQIKKQIKCHLRMSSRTCEVIYFFGSKGATTKFINIEVPITISKKNFKTTLSILKKEKFIKKKAGQIKLTEKGLVEFAKKKVGKTDLLPNEIDCIVVFDIPETQRKIRILLGRLLTELAFIKIQKSVWISQFDNAKPLKELLVLLKLKKWVRIFTGKEE